MFFTRRNLLEWVTAAQTKFSEESKLSAIYERMAGGVVVALAAIAGIAFAHHRAWAAAAPFLVLWLASPAVALWPLSAAGFICRRR